MGSVVPAATVVPRLPGRSGTLVQYRGRAPLSTLAAMRVLAAALVLAASAVWAQAPAPTPDVAWPRLAKGADGTVILVYQPQIESWAENTLAARAAVAV